MHLTINEVQERFRKAFEEKLRSPFDVRLSLEEVAAALADIAVEICDEVIHDCMNERLAGQTRKNVEHHPV